MLADDDGALLSSEYGLSAKDAKNRGFVLENNPTIKPMKDVDGLEFQLALNTAQTGRTFQDRYVLDPS